MHIYIRQYFILLIIILGVSSTSAQDKVVEHNFNIWNQVKLSHVFNSKWSAASEFHIRRTDGFSKQQQYVIRPSITYKANSKIVITGGYSYLLNSPYGDFPIDTDTPEHNIWMQLMTKSSIGKLNLSHYYRYEHRYLGQSILQGDDYVIDGYTAAQRLRYRLTLQYPLSSSGDWKLKAFDELFVNMFNGIKPLSINQNWLFLGVNHKLSNSVSVELGIMHQLLIKGDNINLEENPTLMLNIGVAL